MMRAAAEADHALAQHGLAFMYLYDEQIERDVLEAVRWLELAVGHGAKWGHDCPGRVVCQRRRRTARYRAG